MDDRVKLISRERAYEGRLLKIDVDQIELAGRGRTRIETIRHPGAAAVLPLLDDERVVLIRQYRHAVDGEIIEVPAGKLDGGEDPAVCARRELREEIGYDPRSLVPLGSILTTPGFTDEVIWLYEGRDLSFVGQQLESHELIATFETTLEEAVRMVLDDRIRDAKSVAAILRAWARRTPVSPATIR
jgi:ADP-ribose pyrophosphatase